MPIFNDLHSFQPADKDALSKERLYAPYLLCNEQNQQDTLSILSDTRNTKNERDHLHIGFSVWFNLDVIATTRPYYAVVLDLDPSVYTFVYPIIMNTIISTNSREEFIPKLLDAIMVSESMRPYKEHFTEQFKNLSGLAYGFLASEDNFNYVKNMLEENRVFFGKGDLNDANDVLTIQKWIKKNNLILKSLYISNIPEWLLQSSPTIWEKTKEIISRLLEPTTQLIDAFYPTTKKDSSGPPLRITEGRMPEYQVTRFNSRLFKKPRFSTEEDSHPPKKDSPG